MAQKSPYGSRKRNRSLKVTNYRANSDAITCTNIQVYRLGFRNPTTNNQVSLTRGDFLFFSQSYGMSFQVFFIDTSGALCSRSSGHAIDIEGEFN